MTRRRSAKESVREMKSRRNQALERLELGDPPSLRAQASGVVSMPIKLINPADSKLIEEFEARKKSGDKALTPSRVDD